MAVAFVRNWTGVTDTDGNVNITGTALVADNWVAVGARCANTESLTIKAVAPDVSLTTGSNKLSIWAIKAAGGETSLTVTGGAGNIWAVLTEFSGIASASALETSVIAAAASAETMTTGTTGVPTNADSMAVAFLMSAGNTTGHAAVDISTTGTGGANYANGSSVGISLINAYKDIAAAEAQNVTWNWGTARASIGGIIVLKGATAGGGTASWSGQDDAPRKRRAWA